MAGFTDAQAWMDAQPDLITCPAMGTKLTLRACKKRLRSEAHYATKISSDPEDGLEVTYSFKPCQHANCEHYVPTKKRAKCYRKSGGNNAPLSKKLNSQIFNAYGNVSPSTKAQKEAVCPNRFLDRT